MRKRSNIKTKTLLRMKITALLLIASFTIVSASNTYSQTTALSIEAKSQTMQTVLEQIESQSEFQFFYNTKQINTKKLVSIKAAGKNVFSVLDELFKDNKTRSHTDGFRRNNANYWNKREICRFYLYSSIIWFCPVLEELGK